jgi:uncharacterized membrane protein
VGMFLATKAVHLLAVSIFLGSLVTVLVAKVKIEATASEPRVVAQMLTVLLAVDSALTGPSAAVVTLTGILLIALLGWNMMGVTWVQALLVFWIASAAVAHLVLLPRLRELAQVASQGIADLNYRRLSHQWTAISAGLIGLQLALFLLALIKP